MSPPILDPIRGVLLRSQPDARLVALTREGRERAFEEIVRRYRAPLVGFAAMIVPAHRADDVVQESLLRAFEALRSSDGEMQLRSWLFRIVRNQALNDVRDTPVHDELTEELDGAARPEEIAERREEIAALIGGLKALPEPQREAIVARELEGRGHAEIAAELGTSSGAVRQLIFRARGSLRSAAGLLVPLPLLRALLGPGGAEASAAAGLGAGAAAGMAAGGGAATGVAGKVAIGLAGAALAVGGGVAVERGSHEGERAVAATGEGSAAEADTRRASTADSGAGGSGSASGASGGGQGSHGARGSGESGHDGESGSGHGGGDSSGPGGGGGDRRPEGDGGGDADDEDEDFDDDDLGDEADDDSDGHGGSGSGGSGSSGSGSGGSGSGDDDDSDLPEVEPPDDDPPEVEPPDDDSPHSGSGPSHEPDPLDD